MGLAIRLFGGGSGIAFREASYPVPDLLCLYGILWRRPDRFLKRPLEAGGRSRSYDRPSRALLPLNGGRGVGGAEGHPDREAPWHGIQPDPSQAQPREGGCQLHMHISEVQSSALENQFLEIDGGPVGLSLIHI